MKIKYYQIVTPGLDGVLRPFEINQFGEEGSYFNSEYEAETFIRNNFRDYQDGVNPGKVELVLSVIPVWLLKYK